MKLLHTMSELKAIKTICESPDTGNLILASTDLPSFHYPPAREAYKHIRDYARESGDLLSWNSLISDPKISEGTRKILHAFKEQAVEDKKRALQLVRRLEHYRKLRGALKAGKTLMDALSGDAVDPEALLDEAAKIIGESRASRSARQELYHFGKNNNSVPIIKKLLDKNLDPVIPTGFSAFDSRNRGFLLGSLVLIGANTGGGKCLVGNTYVATEKGLFTLHELHGSVESGFVPNSSITVHGLDREKTLTDATFNGEGSTWYLITDKGTRIEGLPEHKVVVYNNGTVDWRQIDQIRVGDWLLSIPGIGAGGESIVSADFAFLLGLMGADGKKPSLRNLTRDEAKTILCNNGLNSFTNKVYYCKDNTVRIDLTSLWNTIEEYKIKVAKRQVPTSVRHSISSQRAFIDGVFSTAVVKHEGKSLTHASTDFIHGVKAIMDNLGLPNRLLKRASQRIYGGGSYELIWYREIPLNYDMVPVSGIVTPESDLSIAISRKDAQEYLQTAKYINTNALTEILKYSWSRVMDVGPTNHVRSVYDLSVPETRSYIANSLLTHNTSMAVNLLKNMADMATDCALVSLEMSAEMIYARISSLLTDLPINRISQHNLTKEERLQVKTAYKKWVTSLKENKTRFSIYTPSSDVTIDEVLLSLHPYGYEVVLIDYVSLLKGSGSSESEAQWEVLGETCRIAKRYAEAHNKVIVILVQVSKEGLVKYSKTMVEHANNCLVWLAPDEEAEIMTLEIQQLKARNQQRFPFNLISNNETGHIYSDTDVHAPEQDDEEEDEESGNYAQDLTNSQGEKDD